MNEKEPLQKVEYARASLWCPFYTVGMAARIRGAVTTEAVREVLRKLRVLYPPLASRVVVDASGAAWLTTDGVGELPLEVRARKSEDDWGKIYLEQERIPFRFDRGPVTRFFLLQDEAGADLAAVVPHLVCDGASMAQVMETAAQLLNHPHQGVSRPALAPAVTWKTMPHALLDLLPLRGFVRVLNHTWPNSRQVLDQSRYEEIHQAYWARQKSGLLSFVLPPEVTATLVGRCRQQGVCVTGALTAAFILAQKDLGVSPKTDECRVSVAVSIRDRLVPHPDHQVGVYASSFDVTARPRPGGSFWDLARLGHQRIHRGMKDRSKLLMPLVLQELDPGIADALVTAISTDRWRGEFRMVAPFFKVRGETRCLAISNIGRINLAAMEGPFGLETLLPFPPLVPGTRLALNVLTVEGRMNLITKFDQERLDERTVTRLAGRALEYLLEEKVRGGRNGNS